ADAIHAFHATGIDNHSKLFHLRVNEHIRSAGRGAVATLIARVGNANFSGREFVSETEEPTIRAGVGAKAFRSQKINGHEAADEKKRDGHRDGWKSLPKIAGDQMISELWDQRSVVRVREGSIKCGPTEHVEGGNERDIDQQPRSKRFRSEADLL